MPKFHFFPNIWHEDLFMLTVCQILIPITNLNWFVKYFSKCYHHNNFILLSVEFIVSIFNDFFQFGSELGRMCQNWPIKEKRKAKKFVDCLLNFLPFALKCCLFWRCFLAFTVRHISMLICKTIYFFSSHEA